MDVKYLGALAENLQQAGDVKPVALDYTPTQFEFSRLDEHNQAVSDLRTDFTSIIAMLAELTDKRRSYVETCRDMEGWAEDRYLELSERREAKGYTGLEFANEPVLPTIAAVPLAYTSKEQMPCWGRQVGVKGPWIQLASEGETFLLGTTVGGRWRIGFERDVAVSEVNLTTGPEVFGFYRVIEAKVVSVSSGVLTLDTELPCNQEDVLVDVRDGFHEGFWFTGTAQRATITGCNAPLIAGEQLTISVPVESYSLGRGIYEVEDDHGPVWGKTFDLILGATAAVAWVGLPSPQFSFKVYAPETEVLTIGEVEPTDLVRLKVTEAKPEGADISYELVPDENIERANVRLVSRSDSLSGTATEDGATRDPRTPVTGAGIANREPYPITPNTTILSRTAFSPVHCVEETMLDRYLRAHLTWAPVVDRSTISEYGLGYNPNRSVQDTNTPALWWRWTDPATEVSDLGDGLWLYSGGHELGDWGVATTYNATVDDADGFLAEEYGCLRLTGNGRAGLRSSGWVPNTWAYRCNFRFVSPYTLARTAGDGWEDQLYAGTCAEWNVREGYSGEGISVRMVPWFRDEDGHHILGIGVYRKSFGVGGMALETIGTVSMNSLVPQLPTYYCQVYTPDSSIPIVSTSTLVTQAGYQYTGMATLATTEVYRGWTWVTLGFEDGDQSTIKVRTYAYDNGMRNDYVGEVTAATFSYAGRLPSGGGMSFVNGLYVGATAATLDVDQIEAYMIAGTATPVRVEGILGGRSIPPNITGTSVDQLQPEKIIETLYPQADGTFRLSASPVARWAGASDIIIYAMDFEGTRGETLYSGEAASGRGKVSIAGNVLTLRGSGHEGAIQVEYWGVPKISGKVPFTHNVTNYLSPTQSRSLHPIDDNIDSENYYPVVEYLHKGRDLYFANELDSVTVAYDTYATFLRVRAKLTRGINPCRSPRITAGHWELA